MSSKEKKLSLFFRLINKLFIRKGEKSSKGSAVRKAINTMQNEEENFLFI